MNKNLLNNNHILIFDYSIIKYYTLKLLHKYDILLKYTQLYWSVIVV